MAWKGKKWKRTWTQNEGVGNDTRSHSVVFFQVWELDDISQIIIQLHVLGNKLFWFCKTCVQKEMVINWHENYIRQELKSYWKKNHLWLPLGINEITNKHNNLKTVPLWKVETYVMIAHDNWTKKTYAVPETRCWFLIDHIFSVQP